jgi:uncharacterized protein YutD
MERDKMSKQWDNVLLALEDAMESIPHEQAIALANAIQEYRTAFFNTRWNQRMSEVLDTLEGHGQFYMAMEKMYDEENKNVEPGQTLDHNG